MGHKLDRYLRERQCLDGEEISSASLVQANLDYHALGMQRSKIDLDDFLIGYFEGMNRSKIEDRKSTREAMIRKQQTDTVGASAARAGPAEQEGCSDMGEDYIYG